MSKRKSTSNAAAATYDSDGGFVEDAPRSKKAKKGASGASVVKDGKGNGKSEGGDMKMKMKKKGAGGGGKEVGKEVVGGGQVGRDGEEFWEVGFFDCFVCLWVGVGMGMDKEGRKRGEGGREGAEGGSGWGGRMWGLGNWLTLGGGVCS